MAASAPILARGRGLGKEGTVRGLWERGRGPGPRERAPPASSGAGARQAGGRGGAGGGVGCKMAAGGRASPGAGVGGGDGRCRPREGSARRAPLWAVRSRGPGWRGWETPPHGESGERDRSAGASPGNMAGGGGGFPPAGPMRGGGRGGSQRSVPASWRAGGGRKQLRSGWGAAPPRAGKGGDGRNRCGSSLGGGRAGAMPRAGSCAPAHLAAQRFGAGGGRGAGLSPYTPLIYPFRGGLDTPLSLAPFLVLNPES